MTGVCPRCKVEVPAVKNREDKRNTVLIAAHRRRGGFPCVEAQEVVIVSRMDSRKSEEAA